MSLLSSNQINHANHNFVKQMIEQKNSSIPYYSSGPSVQTDMDVFPYTRFYRGTHKSDLPITFQREAGWRARNNKCYNEPVVKPETDLYPNHCFQAAPSTTYPCYPEYQRKYSDKEAMQLQLFRKGINEYR
jgi:hypothetical protein